MSSDPNAVLVTLAASAQSTATALERLTALSAAQAQALSAQASAAEATRQAREAEVHTANLAKEAKWREEALKCSTVLEFLSRLVAPNRTPGSHVQFKFIHEVLVEVAAFWRHHDPQRRKISLTTWLDHSLFSTRVQIPAALRDFDGQFVSEHGPAWLFEILAAVAVPQISLSAELDVLTVRHTLGQFFVELQPLMEFCVLQRCRLQPVVAADHVRAGIEADDRG